MNQEDLIAKLAQSAGFSAGESKKVLESFVRTVRAACKSGDTVAIPGFGTFQPLKTGEQIVFDASAGKRFLIPPSVKVIFKSSVVLRKKLIG